ncbi:uncharacterized protein vcpip1 [Gymnodraco acuticeps]|uniref:Uncharacterized protein vcpip1 n=1 Tax=Gymnodraco acuticeps TaxID=8218 RepID=A0A6P8U9Y7_GYMAC|nr:uncharacterized protein vcpip1 [Gymnodraco acuticeps]
MGLLDGKHCSLPHLTGKTFVFNAATERLDLCVDAAGHFPVSPEVEEQVKEALLQLQVRSEASGGQQREQRGVRRAEARRRRRGCGKRVVSEPQRFPGEGPLSRKLLPSGAPSNHAAAQQWRGPGAPA